MDKQAETDFDKMENVGKYFIDLAKRGRELIAAFETQIEPKPEPKKEPRGLCWASRGMYSPRIRRICGHIGNGQYYDEAGDIFDNAIPLTESEMQEYRGRWE